jgi:hypothetical protein
MPLPRTPFPFPLGIGTDICSIPRVRRILELYNGRAFVRRVLSRAEIKGLQATPKHGKWMNVVFEKRDGEDATTSRKSGPEDYVGGVSGARVSPTHWAGREELLATASIHLAGR